MFAKHAVVDEISEFRQNYFVNTAGVMERYPSAIRYFWGKGDFKSQRHAWRMTVNLDEMLDRGRFTPELSEDQIDYITAKVNAGREPKWLTSETH